MREQNYGEITELNSKQHILWIEHLRAISIIAVIAIHTIYTAILLFGDGYLNENGMIMYCSAMNMFLWGVPCFLMITGFLLLNPEKGDYIS